MDGGGWNEAELVGVAQTVESAAACDVRSAFLVGEAERLVAEVQQDEPAAELARVSPAIEAEVLGQQQERVPDQCDVWICDQVLVLAVSQLVESWASPPWAVLL